MKRLTKKIGKHYTFHDCDIICDQCFGGCKVSQRVMDKYGELEDLLEKELGDVAKKDKIDWERLRELVKADKEERVIVLPCAVGTEYYTVDKFCTEDGYYAEPVIHCFGDCDGCDCRCDKEWRPVKHVFYSASSILMLQESIGKGIFLTLEEAERRKAELEGKNEELT